MCYIFFVKNCHSIIYLIAQISIYLSISVFLPINLLTNLSISVRLSIYLSIYQFQSIYLSIYLSISVCLSIDLLTNLSIYLSQSVYLSIWLKIQWLCSRQRGKTLLTPKRCPGFDTKLLPGVRLLFLSFGKCVITLLLPLLPGPLWYRVVVAVRVLSTD